MYVISNPANSRVNYSVTKVFFLLLQNNVEGHAFHSGLPAHFETRCRNKCPSPCCIAYNVSANYPVSIYLRVKSE